MWVVNCKRGLLLKRLDGEVEERIDVRIEIAVGNEATVAGRVNAARNLARMSGLSDDDKLVLLLIMHDDDDVGRGVGDDAI